ncbi:unnamed protein product, partial [Brassica rapa subsp. trilocularis]
WNLSPLRLQSSHLNICYYHQDLHRQPLRPGSRPRFCIDRCTLLLIQAWLLPRRPGIVHHLSGPDRHAHTRTLLRRSRSVGCAPPTGRRPEHADAEAHREARAADHD